MGVRQGKRTLNLTDYIGRGIVTECFRMDTERNKDRLYLTVKISVFDAKQDSDIATMSLLATNMTSTRSTTLKQPAVKSKAKTKTATNFDEEDEDEDESDEDFVVTGKDVKDAYLHYH